MTWNANKPASNESPSLAPQQIRNNWLRLQNILTQDHNFTTATASDQGWHKIVHHINQTGDMGDNTPLPVAGTGQTYTKEITTTGVGGSTAGAGEHLVYQRGTGGGQLQEAALSVCPVRAAVNFDGRTTAGPATVNWGYNVLSVTWTSQGRYTIEFDVDMPSLYYIVTGTALQVTITSSVNNTRAATIVSRVKAVGTVRITVSAVGGNIDPDSIDIVIYGG